MRSENIKANDLFLLMLNLSQVSSREKIIDVFLEAISEIWPDVTPRFSLSSSESENNSIEIATSGSHFGFISIENFTELKSENQDLLHNACGLLAVILRKNEHEALLADEKLHLHKLVEKRTYHLNKEIQDRKQAEQKLLESEAKYRHLYETMTQGVLIQDADGSIIEANNAACEILGLTMDQMLGKTPYDPRWRLIHEDGSPYDPEKVPSNIALRTGKPAKGIHCGIYVPEKGEYRWIVIGSVPRFKDGETKPFVTTTVFTDITELKKLESKLLQSQKMESIGTLSGGIAHDFNNIMAIIMGNTELALNDVPKWNPAHSSLEEIKTASLRAKNIVKQLLSFSRKTDQKLQPIQIASVIKDTLQFLRSTIPTTVEIHKHIPDDEIVILANSTQINQVMMNLCINASQAMEETGGTLKINIEKTICEAEDVKEFSDLIPGNYLKITVNDTGPGISPKIINQIFDPYFTTKEIGKGSGMGLSIVHGIVKNHNGAIWVDSSLGKGTTFTLLFPMVEGKPVNETETIDKIPRGDETILFVDDEESILRLTQKILKRLGYKVETSLNPLQAMDLFQSKPDSFDLVITDMTMPQMTGVKLAQKLKKFQPDLPVIICTGHSSLIDEEKAKRLGVDGYVMKPASMSTIAKAIRKVLDK